VFFDGTVLAQKALSAIARLKEQEPLSVIVDFLRGSKNAYMYEKQYQDLKTYGIGGDTSWYDWNQYLIQLINLGYCEIAFHQKNKILLTPFARKVLFEGQKVQLTSVVKKAVDYSESKSVKKRTPANSLFDILRQLRYDISKEESVPAYVIFNDATLRQLETVRPMSESEFLTIDGVGKAKLEKYGAAFIDAITTFQQNKKTKDQKEGSTYKVTLALYQQGISVEDIASQRKLGISTVLSHIAKLYVDGHISDVSAFVSAEEVRQIKAAQTTFEPTTALKPYFDYFEAQMPYEKIRMGLAVLEKESGKITEYSE
jgi:ATP-dependent DNA helicase RecQ